MIKHCPDLIGYEEREGYMIGSEEMKKYKEYEFSKNDDKDHVATPRWVVENIYDIIDIKSFNQIWFPFNHYDSEFKLKADELKLQYWATHIFDDCGHDFFTTLPPKGTDLMISNPPFSDQNKIIKRSFWLIEKGYIKSFALLLPLATLETETRANIYDCWKDKLSIIVLRRKERWKNLYKRTNLT